MGDIIHANPALVALRENYFESEIHWLVFDSFSGMLNLFPNINKPVIWPRKKGFFEFLRLVISIRKERYDLVVDLQGLMRTALISFLSGAKKRVAVPGVKEFGWLFEKEVFPENKNLNAVYRNLEPVRYLSGKEIVPRFNIHVSRDSENRAEQILEQNGVSGNDRPVAIVPQARGKSKQWPLEYFDNLIKTIREKNSAAKIIVLGTQKGLLSGAVDLSGKTDFETLAGIIKRCRVVVGPDTGPLHLAAAMGVPTVFLFGGSDVNETSPISNNAEIIKKEYSCSPCRSKPTCKDIPCMKDIKPDEVYGKIEKWMS